MATTPTSRNEWLFGHIRNPFEDKEYMVKHEVIKMLNKTTQMFKYKNLPDTIPEKDLETLLQVNGYAIFKKVDDALYVFYGGLGGEPNVYYLPTKAVIANPALKYNATLTIDEDCVVMLNDYYYQGLMPLFSKYARMLVEAELSLKQSIINARVPALIQADNDNTYHSAQEFFKKITEGKDYGVIATAEFFDGIRTQDFYKYNHITDLIEAIQYIKGSWFNEVGLRASFNMKREAINEAEASMNDDILEPVIDGMLKCRQDALEKVNKMFGTNITVELNSVWYQNDTERDLNIELIEATIDDIETKGGDA